MFEECYGVCDFVPTKLVQVLCFLGLGLYVGYICGLGHSYSRLESMSKQKANIIGNITIVPNGKHPISIRGVHVDMVDNGQPAFNVVLPDEGE